jgi:hypothetical protein
MTQDRNIQKEKKPPAEEVSKITRIVVRMQYVINIVWITDFALPATWPG